MVEWPGGRVNEALQILECALRHPSGFKAGRWELVAWLLAEVRKRPVPPLAEKRMAELLVPHLQELRRNERAWQEVLAIPTLAVVALIGAERSVFSALHTRHGSWQWVGCILPQLARRAHASDQTGRFVRFALVASLSSLCRESLPRCREQGPRPPRGQCCLLGLVRHLTRSVPGPVLSKRPFAGRLAVPGSSTLSAKRHRDTTVPPGSSI